MRELVDEGRSNSHLKLIQRLPCRHFLDRAPRFQPLRGSWKRGFTYHNEYPFFYLQSLRDMCIYEI